MNASVGCKTGWQVRSFFSSSCGSFWRLFEILFVPNCWVSPLAQPQSCRTPDDRYSIYIEFVLCLTWMGPNYYVCWLTIKHNHKSVGAPCSWSTVCGEVPVDGHLKVSPRFRLQEGECRASSRKGGVRVIEQPERQKYILSNVPSSWFLQKHCVSQLHDKLSKQKAGKRKQASRFKLCYRDKTTHFCKELKKKTPPRQEISSSRSRTKQTTRTKTDVSLMTRVIHRNLTLWCRWKSAPFSPNQENPWETCSGGTARPRHISSTQAAKLLHSKKKHLQAKRDSHIQILKLHVSSPFFWLKKETFFQIVQYTS